MTLCTFTHCMKLQCILCQVDIFILKKKNTKLQIKYSFSGANLVLFLQLVGHNALERHINYVDRAS